MRPNPLPREGGWLNQVVRLCLENRLVVILVVILLVLGGLITAPFDWELAGLLPRYPVPVDAIPDIGENQQIVFAEWPGRSPQDIEDQVTYPLTVALLGLPGVKTVRSYSYFGFTSVYVIFNEGVDFYWSRSRVMEKLSSLSPGTLPEGVQPILGPDATALGQVYWYTLEGLDAEGEPTGGWDLDELRTTQDWYVRYALLGVEGVAEVASVGGFVREYQIDLDPDAMRAAQVTLPEVFNAVRMSNLDIGARSIEINRVEYVVRGRGLLASVGDIEETVVKARSNVPIRIRDVARVSVGPALRRGALDKAGAEAVGGVVVVRYGENPLAAIRRTKAKVAEISGGLPEKMVIDFDRVSNDDVVAFARKNGFDAYRDGGLNQAEWLAWWAAGRDRDRPAWVTHSKVHIVPFYDRAGLIYETLGTLNTAISLEILITMIVILLLVRNLRSSVLVAGLLPLAVLMTFIAMKQFGVDANIVALSGIAIAIGTMVDMGIVVSENIQRHLVRAGDKPVVLTVYRATCEVAGAVVTAVATTVVGFLPVFAMQAAEGKLFKPLAYTKTFAMLAAVLIALTVIPVVAAMLFRRRIAGARSSMNRSTQVGSWTLIAAAALVLGAAWLPLGPEQGRVVNTGFVVLMIAMVLIPAHVMIRVYPRCLAWVLDYKRIFLLFPGVAVLWGALIWLGAGGAIARLPASIQTWGPVSKLAHAFPGLGKEFMPPLDEGSFLLMPTTMPHASIGEALDVLQKQDLAMQAVPEIKSVVGKLGRADSALDPAPISMFETVINYLPEYRIDRNGKRLRYRYHREKTDVFRGMDGTPLPGPDGEPYRVQGRFERDEAGRLIADSRGAAFRLWRPLLDPALNPGRDAWPGITSPDDIWKQILDAVKIPGTTSAPALQPIAARIVMLQSGMRAPMGVKITGPDLATIERVGLEIERHLKRVPAVNPETVNADRIVGKPYLEIDVDRSVIARYGLHMQQVQEVIQVAIGGTRVTTTVEGRERYPVRVRYLRELRDSIESLDGILVPTPGGAQVPLAQLAEIRYVRGPQVIKSEDTFLVGYVVFDRYPGHAEVDVVRRCEDYLDAQVAAGALHIPEGVSFRFSGSYENQLRAAQRLALLIPVALVIIFVILYLQFRSALTSLMVFSGILVAWSGGFIMLWLYGQDSFLGFRVMGVEMRTLFQIHPVNLSVAVWVGFLALFGIASDDGVLMATILDQQFDGDQARDRTTIRKRVVEGASRRIRPAMMTTATTLIALLPILSSNGRGADIMIPMAIPTFGGMAVAVLTVFVVPVLYCARQERGCDVGNC